MDGAPTEEAPSGSTEAFESFFRELYRPLLSFFIQRGCSREQGQDLAQETFLRAYTSFDRFRGESKRSTWLFTIAANLWSNFLRDGSAAKRDGGEVALSESRDPADAGESPQDRAIGVQRQALLRAAIEELPPQMRRCVGLRVYQERSYREIAELLGIGAAGAKSQVSLARKKLRTELAGHYPELDDGPKGR